MRTAVLVVGLAAACLGSPRATAEDATAIPLAEHTMTRRDAATPAGGTLVELLRDSVTLLLPTDREAVAAALARLAVWPRVEGFRGGPPGDAEAVVDAVMAVAGFAESRRDRLVELDVNPLIVRPKGEGAVAADALVRLVEG
jgi:hypothetical protein